MRKVRINFWSQGPKFGVSESLSDRCDQTSDSAITESKTEKMTSFFADLWSQSIFWTQQ